ncbi:pentapeptide repeat-containing protein [Streptomyces sp. NPDC055060]
MVASLACLGRPGPLVLGLTDDRVLPMVGGYLSPSELGQGQGLPADGARYEALRKILVGCYCEHCVCRLTARHDVGMYKTRLGWIRATRIVILATMAALILFAAISVLVWRGPWWFDGKYISSRDLKSGSAALVTGFRTAVVQLLVALGASIALVYTARNYRLNRRGQVTDRFIKALERLGSDELYVRIGGILAMEQIVHDAPDQAAHAAQVLNTFIRQRAPRWENDREKGEGRAHPSRDALEGKRGETEFQDSDQLDADLQVALNAVTNPVMRRSVGGSWVLDLSYLYLPRVDLAEADLRGAVLNSANLRFSNLARADLRGVNLTEATLNGSRFDSANLRGANIAYSNLRSSNFNGADLSGAHLEHANIMHARFVKSILVDVGLVWANMQGVTIQDAEFRNACMANVCLIQAWIERVSFDSADVEDAEFTDAGLREANLASAIGLTVEQVISAWPNSLTVLSPDISSDPRVKRRVVETTENYG